MQTTKNIAPEVIDLAEQLGIGDRFFAIMDVTQETFPGPIVAETGHDPEWPDDRWITLIVNVSGTMQDFVRQQSQWNECVRGLIPDCPGAIGLSFF
jgi:hypothetical protein